jgi:hypothetical protein
LIVLPLVPVVLPLLPVIDGAIAGIALEEEAAKTMEFEMVLSMIEAVLEVKSCKTPDICEERMPPFV